MKARHSTLSTLALRIAPTIPVSLVLAVISTALSLSPELRAGTKVWTGAGSNGNWSTDANWTGGVAPVNGDEIRFGDNVRTSNVDDLGLSSGGGLTLSSILFYNYLVSFQIRVSGAYSLTLNGSGVVNASSITQSFVTEGASSSSVYPSDIRFRGNASAGAATSYTNEAATDFGNSLSYTGGTTSFGDNATAGTATFVNNGSRGFSYGDFGKTVFSGASSAGSGVFLTLPATVSGDQYYGGATWFDDSSTASQATILVNGATVAGARGGGVLFFGNSTADAASLIITAGSNGGLGGTVSFSQNASGGTARITNAGTLAISGVDTPGISLGSIEGGGSFLLGSKSLTVGSLGTDTTVSGVISDVVDSLGTRGSLVKVGAGKLTLSGVNTYTGNTTVNAGTLEVSGQISSSLYTTVNQGGTLIFSSGTTAGTHDFIAYRSDTSSTLPGLIKFMGANTSAGTASFTNTEATVSGGFGGETIFYDTSTASSAHFGNPGGFVNGARGGSTAFRDSASAGSASFLNAGGEGSGGPGRTEFFESSTAANGTFTNVSTHVAIVGGQTNFKATSSAGNATIINNGGTLSGAPGGLAQFFDSATAANANITSNGGSASGAGGGEVAFGDTATAGAATLISNGGTNGGAGGRTLFFGDATGGTARVITNAGGTFDISYSTSGIAVGSIEGAGTYNLGSGTLTFGSRGTDTTVSGTIADGGLAGGTGGSITKAGTGVTTLNSTNSFTGTTTVNGGTLAANSSISGPVMVNAGGIFDISGLPGTNLNVGSIGGTGIFRLGSKTLTFGSLNGTDTVSVSIQDGGLSGGTGGSLVKVGTGTTTLSGSNTYTGSTTVKDGTLQLSNPVAAPAIPGALFIGDAIGATGSATVRLLKSEQIQDSAAVTIANDGVLDLGTFTDTIGTLTMTGGTVSGSGAGTLKLGGDVTATADAAGNAATISAKIDLNGATRTLTANSGPGSRALVVGTIVGSGGVTKAGSGVLQFAGASTNTFTGTTSVPDSTLELNSTAADGAIPGPLVIGDSIGAAGSAIVRTLRATTQISNTSAVTIHGDGLLDLNSFSDQIGALTINPGGAVTLGTGTIACTDLTMTGGAISGAGGNQGRLTLSSSLTTTTDPAGNNPTITVPISITNNSLPVSFTVNDGVNAIDLRLDVPISGSAGPMITGGGTVQFGGDASNDYGGVTTVDNGVLLLNKTGGATAVPATLVIEGTTGAPGSGTVRLLQSEQIADASPVTISGDGRLDVNGQSESVGPLTITGAGSATIGAGTLRPSSLTMTGGLVSGSAGGKLLLGGNVTATSNGAGAATISADVDLNSPTRTFIVNDGPAAMDLLISGGISNGGVTKDGLGTLTVSGPLSYTGATSVNAGVMQVSGTSLSSSAVTTRGATASGGPAGTLQFLNAGSAGTATITTTGGTGTNAAGGVTHFSGNSTASTATLVTNAGSSGGLAGFTKFTDTATAGTANITTNSGATTEFFNSATGGGSTIVTDNGGKTIFIDTATAGSASVRTKPGGSTEARGNATGGSATFTIDGAVGGATRPVLHFYDSATAGNATLTAKATSANIGGLIQFHNTATAGAASFTVEGAAHSNGGATLEFLDSSTAGTATIGNLSTTAAFENQGAQTVFNAGSRADHATITNFAGTGANLYGGQTVFNSGSTAERAAIFNEGGGVSYGGYPYGAGTTFFNNGSTAGNAAITNRGASFSTSQGGQTFIRDGASAGSAAMTNRGGTVSGAPGGMLDFSGTSLALANAGSATLTSEGAAISGAKGGQTVFSTYGTGGTATIIANGGTVSGALGGQTIFKGNTTAGSATLIANGGTNGGAGGTILIQTGSSTSAASARAIANTGGIFDMSGVLDLTVGSIAGAGRFNLGSTTLTTGGLNTNTIVSGVLADGGVSPGGSGKLTKIGTGQLTLSGVNTYTGLTTVNAGTLSINGSIPGAVTVNSGATLKGTGTIGGVVTVNPGGIHAPGTSPGTMTVGGLNLASGATLDLELGSASDRLIVNGNATLGGTINVIDSGGFSAGTAYQLINVTGAITDAGYSLGSVPSGSNLVVQTSVPRQLNLVALPGAGGPALQYWDGATFTANGTVHGGSGNFGGSATNWTNIPASASSAWAQGIGVFTGNAGTVALTSNIAFAGLQFAADGYVIAASGSNSLVPTGTAKITVDSGVTTVISAGLSGTGGLSKEGPGTLNLTAANDYTGPTVVTGAGSTLTLGTPNGRLTGTTAIEVANAGTLLLAVGSERLNDAASLKLGGSLAFAGNLNGTTETLGTLSLTADSVIDFGMGNSDTFKFSALALGGHTLEVWNWTGTTYGLPPESDHGGTQDRLLLGSDLSGGTLSQIHFYSDSGSDFLGAGAQIVFGASFEIVPVPEPSPVGLFSATVLLTFARYRGRRAAPTMNLP